MAAKVIKQRYDDSQLQVDTRYDVNGYENTTSPVILSPGGSTQKLIKDGKIKECFVALIKQNLMKEYLNEEVLEQLSSKSCEDQTVPVLSKQRVEIKYDYNANFRSESSARYHDHGNQKVEPNKFKNFARKRSPSKRYQNHTKKKKHKKHKHHRASKNENEHYSLEPERQVIYSSALTQSLNHNHSINDSQKREETFGSETMSLNQKSFSNHEDLPLTSSSHVLPLTPTSSHAHDNIFTTFHKTFQVNKEGAYRDLSVSVQHTCGRKSKPKYKKLKRKHSEDTNSARMITHSNSKSNTFLTDSTGARITDIDLYCPTHAAQLAAKNFNNSTSSTIEQIQNDYDDVVILLQNNINHSSNREQFKFQSSALCKRHKIVYGYSDEYSETRSESKDAGGVYCITTPLSSPSPETNANFHIFQQDNRIIVKDDDCCSVDRDSDEMPHLELCHEQRFVPEDHEHNENKEVDAGTSGQGRALVDSLLSSIPNSIKNNTVVVQTPHLDVLSDGLSDINENTENTVAASSQVEVSHNNLAGIGEDTETAVAVLMGMANHFEDVNNSKTFQSTDKPRNLLGVYQKQNSKASKRCNVNPLQVLSQAVECAMQEEQSSLNKNTSALSTVLDVPDNKQSDQDSSKLGLGTSDGEYSDLELSKANESRASCSDVSDAEPFDAEESRLRYSDISDNSSEEEVLSQAVECAMQEEQSSLNKNTSALSTVLDVPDNKQSDQDSSRLGLGTSDGEYSDLELSKANESRASCSDVSDAEPFDAEESRLRYSDISDNSSEEDMGSSTLREYSDAEIRMYNSVSYNESPTSDIIKTKRLDKSDEERCTVDMSDMSDAKNIAISSEEHPKTNANRRRCSNTSNIDCPNTIRTNYSDLSDADSSMNETNTRFNDVFDANSNIDISETKGSDISKLKEFPNTYVMETKSIVESDKVRSNMDSDVIRCNTKSDGGSLHTNIYEAKSINESDIRGAICDTSNVNSINMLENEYSSPDISYGNHPKTDEYKSTSDDALNKECTKTETIRLTCRDDSPAEESKTRFKDIANVIWTNYSDVSDDEEVPNEDTGIANVAEDEIPNTEIPNGDQSRLIDGDISYEEHSSESSSINSSDAFDEGRPIKYESSTQNIDVSNRIGHKMGLSETKDGHLSGGNPRNEDIDRAKLEGCSNPDISKTGCNFVSDDNGRPKSIYECEKDISNRVTTKTDVSDIYNKDCNTDIIRTRVEDVSSKDRPKFTDKSDEELPIQDLSEPNIISNKEHPNTDICSTKCANVSVQECSAKDITNNQFRDESNKECFNTKVRSIDVGYTDCSDIDTYKTVFSGDELCLHSHQNKEIFSTMPYENRLNMNVNAQSPDNDSTDTNQGRTEFKSNDEIKKYKTPGNDGNFDKSDNKCTDDRIQTLSCLSIDGVRIQQTMGSEEIAEISNDKQKHEENEFEVSPDSRVKVNEEYRMDLDNKYCNKRTIDEVEINTQSNEISKKQCFMQEQDGVNTRSNSALSEKTASVQRDTDVCTNDTYKTDSKNQITVSLENPVVPDYEFKKWGHTIDSSEVSTETMSHFNEKETNESVRTVKSTSEDVVGRTFKQIEVNRNNVEISSNQEYTVKEETERQVAEVTQMQFESNFNRIDEQTSTSSLTADMSQQMPFSSCPMSVSSKETNSTKLVIWCPGYENKSTEVRRDREDTKKCKDEKLEQFSDLSNNENTVNFDMTTPFNQIPSAKDPKYKLQFVKIANDNVKHAESPLENEESIEINTAKRSEDLTHDNQNWAGKIPRNVINYAEESLPYGNDLIGDKGQLLPEISNNHQDILGEDIIAHYKQSNNEEGFSNIPSDFVSPAGNNHLSDHTEDKQDVVNECATDTHYSYDNSAESEHEEILFWAAHPHSHADNSHVEISNEISEIANNLTDRNIVGCQQVDVQSKLMPKSRLSDIISTLGKKISRNNTDPAEDESILESTHSKECDDHEGLNNLNETSDENDWLKSRKETVKQNRGMESNLNEMNTTKRRSSPMESNEIVSPNTAASRSPVSFEFASNKIHNIILDVVDNDSDVAMSPNPIKVSDVETREDCDHHDHISMDVISTNPDNHMISPSTLPVTEADETSTVAVVSSSDAKENVENTNVDEEENGEVSVKETGLDIDDNSKNENTHSLHQQDPDSIIIEEKSDVTRVSTSNNINPLNYQSSSSVEATDVSTANSNKEIPAIHHKIVPVIDRSCSIDNSEMLPKNEPELVVTSASAVNQGYIVPQSISPGISIPVSGSIVSAASAINQGPQSKSPGVSIPVSEPTVTSASAVNRGYIVEQSKSPGVSIPVSEPTVTSASAINQGLQSKSPGVSIPVSEPIVTSASAINQGPQSKSPCISIPVSEPTVTSAPAINQGAQSKSPGISIPVLPPIVTSASAVNQGTQSKSPGVNISVSQPVVTSASAVNQGPQSIFPDASIPVSQPAVTNASAVNQGYIVPQNKSPGVSIPVSHPAVTNASAVNQGYIVPQSKSPGVSIPVLQPAVTNASAVNQGYIVPQSKSPGVNIPVSQPAVTSVSAVNQGYIVPQSKSPAVNIPVSEAAVTNASAVNQGYIVPQSKSSGVSIPVQPAVTHASAVNQGYVVPQSKSPGVGIPVSQPTVTYASALNQEYIVTQSKSPDTSINVSESTVSSASTVSQGYIVASKKPGVNIYVSEPTVHTTQSDKLHHDEPPKHLTPEKAAYIHLRQLWTRDGGRDLSRTDEIRELLTTNHLPQSLLQPLASGELDILRGPPPPYPKQSATSPKVQGIASNIPDDVNSHVSPAPNNHSIVRSEVHRLANGKEVVVGFDENGRGFPNIPPGMIDLQLTGSGRNLHTVPPKSPYSSACLGLSGTLPNVPVRANENRRQSADDQTKDESTIQFPPLPPTTAVTRKEGAINQVLELSKLYLKTLETQQGREAVLSDIERLERMSRASKQHHILDMTMKDRENNPIIEQQIVANTESFGQNVIVSPTAVHDTDRLNKIAEVEIRRLQQLHKHQEEQAQWLQRGATIELKVQKRVDLDRLQQIHYTGLQCGQMVIGNHDTESNIRKISVADKTQMPPLHRIEHTQKYLRQPSTRIDVEMMKQFHQIQESQGRILWERQHKNDNKGEECTGRNPIKLIPSNNNPQEQELLLQQLKEQHQRYFVDSHIKKASAHHLPQEKIAVKEYGRNMNLMEHGLDHSRRNSQLNPMPSTLTTKPRQHSSVYNRVPFEHPMSQQLQQHTEGTTPVPQQQLAHELHLLRQQQFNQQRIVMQQNSAIVRDQLKLMRIKQALNEQVTSKSHVQDIQRLTTNMNIPQPIDAKSIAEHSPSGRYIPSQPNNALEKVADSTPLLHVLPPRTLENAYAFQQIERIVQNHIVKTSDAVFIPTENPLRDQTSSQNVHVSHPITYTKVNSVFSTPSVIPPPQYSASHGVDFVQRIQLQEDNVEGLRNAHEFNTNKYLPPYLPHHLTKPKHNLINVTKPVNEPKDEKSVDAPRTEYFTKLSPDMNSIYTPDGHVPVITLEKLKSFITDNPKVKTMFGRPSCQSSTTDYVVENKEVNKDVSQQEVSRSLNPVISSSNLHKSSDHRKPGNGSNQPSHHATTVLSVHQEPESTNRVKKQNRLLSESDIDYFYLILDHCELVELGKLNPLRKLRSDIPTDSRLLIPIYADRFPSGDTHTNSADETNKHIGEMKKQFIPPDGINFADFVQMISTESAETSNIDTVDKHISASPVSASEHSTQSCHAQIPSPSEVILTNLMAPEKSVLQPALVQTSSQAQNVAGSQEIQQYSKLCDCDNEKLKPSQKHNREWAVVPTSQPEMSNERDKTGGALKMKFQQLSVPLKRKRGRPKGSTKKLHVGNEYYAEKTKQEQLCPFCDFKDTSFRVLRQHVKEDHFAKFQIPPSKSKWNRNKQMGPREVYESQQETLTALTLGFPRDKCMQRQLSDSPAFSSIAQNRLNQFYRSEIQRQLSDNSGTVYAERLQSISNQDHTPAFQDIPNAAVKNVNSEIRGASNISITSEGNISTQLQNLNSTNETILDSRKTTDLSNDISSPNAGPYGENSFVPLISRSNHTLSENARKKSSAEEVNNQRNGHTDAVTKRDPETHIQTDMCLGIIHTDCEEHDSENNQTSERQSAHDIDAHESMFVDLDKETVFNSDNSDQVVSVKNHGIAKEVRSPKRAETTEKEMFRENNTTSVILRDESEVSVKEILNKTNDNIKAALNVTNIQELTVKHKCNESLHAVTKNDSQYENRANEYSRNEETSTKIHQPVDENNLCANEIQTNENHQHLITDNETKPSSTFSENASISYGSNIGENLETIKPILSTNVIVKVTDVLTRIPCDSIYYKDDTFVTATPPGSPSTNVVVNVKDMFPEGPSCSKQKYSCSNEMSSDIQNTNTEIIKTTNSELKSRDENRKQPMVTENYAMQQQDLNGTTGSKNRCSKCQQTFPTPARLFAHFKLVHSNTKGLHLCYTCGYTTRVSSILQRHIMKWHTKGEKRKCTSKFCGKTFDTAEELKQHMREHFSNKGKFECRLCGQSYFHVTGLRAHQARHTYDYPFKCGQCGLKFKTKGMLERHEFQRKHFSSAK